MTGRKAVVVMTASGRVKEHSPGSDMQEVLEDVYQEYQRATGEWDRPSKLFVGGECIVDGGLADIAWEYGRFCARQQDVYDAAVADWIHQRFGCKEGGAV